MEDLVLVRHGTLSLSLSLSLSRIAVAVSLVEEIMRWNALILCRRTFNKILGEQTKNQEGSALYLIRFEDTDPNLKTRASGEVGVDPPHYVGVA